jgi:signal transduction histidine kinase
VLNSVNVSATLVADAIKHSRIGNLAKVAALLREHNGNLAEYLATDPKGKLVPDYLASLAEHLLADHETLRRELSQLTRYVEHIKEIVAMQQSYARVAGFTEVLPATELLEDALRINAAAFDRHRIEVVRNYDSVPPVKVDKHKALQIFVNLLSNAKYALDGARAEGKRVTLTVRTDGDSRVRVSITDNGAGIAREHLNRIFNHGFTTRKDGHGFGLHSGANAAREMGGRLIAHSDGPNTGATFTVELPAAPPRPLPQRTSAHHDADESR